MSSHYTEEIEVVITNVFIIRNILPLDGWREVKSMAEANLEEMGEPAEPHFTKEELEAIEIVVDDWLRGLLDCSMPMTVQQVTTKLQYYTQQVNALLDMWERHKAGLPMIPPLHEEDAEPVAASAAQFQEILDKIRRSN